MGRKRHFNSSPEEEEESPTHPETPEKSNSDSELNLSQTPTAKRAKRSGRLSTASSIQVDTPTCTGRKSNKKKKKNKRVKVSHDGSQDGKKDEEIYLGDVPESFTPGRGFLNRSNKKTGKLSIIAPNTPYSEKIARLKREKAEKKRKKGKSLGVEGTVEKNTTPATVKKSGGDDDDGGNTDDGIMDVDGTTADDDEDKDKELVEEQPSAQKSKKNKDVSAAAKKKKRQLVGKGERLLTGKEMMKIFPDLPKPVAPAPHCEEEKEEDKGVGKDVLGEIEEQITRELTNCTGHPPSLSPQTTTHCNSATRMERGFDEAEADDEGGEKEEIRGLIEEIFERPDFLFQGCEKEKAVVVHPGYLAEVQCGMEVDSQGTNTLMDEIAGSSNDGGQNDAGGDVAMIKNLLQALESKINALPLDGKGRQDKEVKDLTKELREVFNGMVKLSGRVHRDEMRAGIRHEILFNGMKKVVGELAVVKRQGDAVMEYLGLKTVSPKERQKWEEKDENKEGKKALESCLRFHLEDMGRAKEKEQLEEKGKLAVEYAGKVLGGG